MASFRANPDTEQVLAAGFPVVVFPATTVGASEFPISTRSTKELAPSVPATTTSAAFCSKEAIVFPQVVIPVAVVERSDPLAFRQVCGYAAVQ